MTAPPSPRPMRAPDAPAAFLRGLQRRATLLAWLQCGDPRRAAPAVAAAARAFQATAPAGPMEQWPVQYWAALVAEPALRAAADDAAWPQALAWLGDLSDGVRAVLLLRLVARLEAAEIAAALQAPLGTVHGALRAALPLRPDGSHDPAAWQARQAALREALDAVPAEPAPVPAPAPVATARRPWNRTRVALWAGVAACVLGLAATFLPFRPPARAGVDAPPAAGVPLPPSEAPVVALEPDLALLVHPDLEQLMDPDDAAVVRDLDLYAWYAARQADGAPAAGRADGAR